MHRVSAAALTNEEAAARFALLAEAGLVALAVSGGPDSTALMGLFAACLPVSGTIVLTVDHGLRAEAAHEAAAVAVAARALGFEHQTLVWEGPHPKTGVQEAARQARYELMAAACAARGITTLVLAHTLDDQAETVLMRLMHGSGLKGLAGMVGISERDGLRLVRPFLDVPKVRLVATCVARGWPFAQDPSNISPAFLRPRLRRLMPQLAEEGLSAQRLATLARRSAEADAVVDRLARAALLLGRGADGSVSSAVFVQSDVAVAVRILTLALADHAGSAAVGLEQIEALAARLRFALADDRPFHATLAGVKITRAGAALRFSAAPPRRARR